MKQPELFRFEPRQLLVSATDAADLVTNEGASCHDFTVNPNHQTPPLDKLRSMFDEIPSDPQKTEAYLLQECIRGAFEAVQNGGYGVAAILATTRNQTTSIIERAQNARIKGHRHQFIGHAEMRLVDQITPYLQQSNVDHSKDVACANLCPCPGCFNHLVDTHIPTVLIGTIDPEVGAAFLRGKELHAAVGKPRAQVMKDKELRYRFPDIADKEIRDILLTLSWEVFHATRSLVHKREHGDQLKE